MVRTCGIPSSDKGAKGMLIDTCCDKENKNNNEFRYDLCNILNLEDASSIELYNIDNNQNIIMYKVNNREILINLLQKYKANLAVKHYMKESEGLKELTNDMTSDMLLREIYTINGKLQKKYLTINTDLKYESFYFTGIIVTVKRHKYYYYISNRCQRTLDKLDSLDIKQLIINYLDSFKILHSKEYYHGDVKPQNMMYCSLEKTDVKYKLIDWGRMYNVHKFDPLYYYGGSKQMGCPLGFYFMFRNISRQQMGIPMGSNIAVQFTFDLIEGKLPLNPIKNPLLIEDKYKIKFQSLWNKIKKSFEEMIYFYTKDENLFSDGLKNDSKIFNKYRFTMDLYNLGLTCLYLMYKHNINNEKYNLWIEKLVCYDKSMIIDTESAIKEFKLINKKLNL